MVVTGDFMPRTPAILLTITALACAANTLQLKDLPAAVQKTVQDTLQGGEIKNIGKETEHGVAQYEVETIGTASIATSTSTPRAIW
jgi:hypothetical protein